MTLTARVQAPRRDPTSKGHVVIPKQPARRGRGVAPSPGAPHRRPRRANAARRHGPLERGTGHERAARARPRRLARGCASAPIHLFTTTSLAMLSRACPEARFDVARFRPDLVCPLHVPSLRHDDAGAGRLAGGLTRPENDSRGEHAALAAAREEAAHCGVHATVVRGGLVRVGDEVRVERGSGRQRFAVLARAVTRAVRRRRR